MTYNEFKLCCTLFCKTFEGQKYGDIVKNCCSDDVHCIVPKLPKFKDRFFVLDTKCVMWLTYNEELKMPLQFKSSLMFKCIQDFLDHFKIPLEDIV